MLDKDIDIIKGVGPKRKEQLNKLNIYTVRDLIYYFPREFEDRSNFIDLSDEYIGCEKSMEVRISGRASILNPRSRMSILKIPFMQDDKKGNLIWFNQNYIKNTVFPGQVYRIYGKIEKNGKNYEINNPIVESLDENNQIGVIMPIYSLTNGISNTQLANIIRNAQEVALNHLGDNLSKDIRDKYKLVDLKDAIKSIHFPDDLEILEQSKRRLIFEELFNLQLSLFYLKNKKQVSDNYIIHKRNDYEINKLIKSLPYDLTRAQEKCFEEINEDMEDKRSMNRLLQGDVGSGKTIVGILAMYKAILSGYQAALMVPTEILASQHYESVLSIIGERGYKVEILTGSQSKSKKEEIKERLKEGKIDIIIGTHALLQEDVCFKNLGLVITDEQHRFGVNQRKILNEKGESPDILVMTATPIPRTLAYILYGDLDISILDELPPNRQKISTYSLGVDYLKRVNKFVDREVAAGRQAYIVAPLVEESDEVKAFSAEELYKIYSDEFKDKYRVGLIHGRMKSKEKEKIMLDFKEGIIQILISTTVIEVGVNVPNASLMLIFNAERFGLAQLHQLRGRVGRGEYKSHCILINQKLNEISKERMNIMIESEDGFVISEKDLELRGPGEFFGIRQHGLPELKIANLFKHMPILLLVQEECRSILNEDPNLTLSKNEVYKIQIEKFLENIVLEDVGN